MYVNGQTSNKRRGTCFLSNVWAWSNHSDLWINFGAELNHLKLIHPMTIDWSRCSFQTVRLPTNQLRIPKTRMNSPNEARNKISILNILTRDSSWFISNKEKLEIYKMKGLWRLPLCPLPEESSDIDICNLITAEPKGSPVSFYYLWVSFGTPIILHRSALICLYR